MVISIWVTYLSIEKDIYDRIPASRTEMFRSISYDVNINIELISLKYNGKFIDISNYVYLFAKINPGTERVGETKFW